MIRYQIKMQRENQLSTESGLISFVGPANWVVALFETNSPTLRRSSPPSLPRTMSQESSLHAQPVKISPSEPLSLLFAYSFMMTVSASILIARNLVPFPAVSCSTSSGHPESEDRAEGARFRETWCDAILVMVNVYIYMADFTLQVSFNINPTMNFNPAIDKSFIRRRLAWITTAIPEANPSRSTLQAVNSFLIRRAI